MSSLARRVKSYQRVKISHIDATLEKLTQHQNKLRAGFYAPLGGWGRYFFARSHNGELQVSDDLEIWHTAPLGTKFTTGSGSEICTY